MTSSASAYDLVFTEYPDIVGIEGLCAMLGDISKKSAYKLIKDKKIEAFRIGKEFRIPKYNILVYLKMAPAHLLNVSANQ